MTIIQPPKPRPCDSCPYRRDVPSGVWDRSHYELIASYDDPTGEQAGGVFLCHQNNGSVCSGWAGCHNQNPPGHELLSLRVVLALREADKAVVEAVDTYRSPVPLWSTGKEAAAHGLRDIEQPSQEATWLRLKLLGRPHIREQSQDAYEALKGQERPRRKPR